MGVSLGHDLVEDVVVPLNRQLEGDTGFLQQVGLDIGSSDLGGWAEVDTDELTLLIMKIQPFIFNPLQNYEIIFISVLASSHIMNNNKIIMFDLIENQLTNLEELLFRTVLALP
jgi:hypothetical protein